MKQRTRLRLIAEGIEGAAMMGAVLFTWPFSRPWLANWGAKSSELEQEWPGDGLVSPNRDTHTRGIDIGAPSTVVWQWVAQFGLGKAGFYSYELLERLIGIPVTNIESIEPTMQSLAVGDEVLLHPKAPGIPVGLLERGRYVCFGKPPGSEPESEATRSRSWSFYVESETAHTSRLVVRSCIERLRDESITKRLLLALEHPVDFVMEQRMLRTVKRLAEASPVARSG